VIVDDNDTTAAWLDVNAILLLRIDSGSDGVAGTTTCISTPSPGWLRTRRVPPKEAVRSRIDHGTAFGCTTPSAPMAPDGAAKPRPLSWITSEQCGP